MKNYCYVYYCFQDTKVDFGKIYFYSFSTYTSSSLASSCSSSFFCFFFFFFLPSSSSYAFASSIWIKLIFFIEKQNFTINLFKHFSLSNYDNFTGQNCNELKGNNLKNEGNRELLFGSNYRDWEERWDLKYIWLNVCSV